MTTTTAPAELVLSAAEVATLIGVKIYELRDLHPMDFGVPGHWRLTKQSAVVYTERGVMGLVDELARLGREAPSAALYAKLVELKQAAETPSRLKVTPGEKSTPPWFRDGPMA